MNFINQQEPTPPTDLALLQKQLDATTCELEELRQEYAEYCYVVSHDFSAPFRRIESFIELILKQSGDQLDEQSTHYFGFITAGAQHCQGLISALLDFSRLNTLAQIIETVDLAALLDDIRYQLCAQIEAHNAQLSIDALPVIEGDKRQLSQLFYHLLHNALLFQPENQQPIITLTIKDHTDRWEFTLCDNGIGITPNMQHKVFVPLRRAVRDDDYPGQGMGLAIARKIVRRHGGEIRIDSTPDEGSTLTFTLLKHSIAR